ncbi:MAG: hypothetical protein WD669_12670 [Pirellulales bacterium]
MAKALAVLTIIAAPVAQLRAQMPFGSGGSAATGSPQQPVGSANGPMQALYLSPPGSSMYGGQPMPHVDAQGNPLVVPANHGQPCDYGYPAPPPMGYAGTCPPDGYGLSADLAGAAAIDGFAVDQRGPHYFDARIEYVNLTREEPFRQQVDFTSLGVNGPIVLSSDQVDVDMGSGFRVMGRYDICPLAVLEFGYMGIYDWEFSESFTDPAPNDIDSGNLYSLFSGFGSFPGVQVQGGPMPQTERSITQSINMDIDFHSAEISYRRYWVGFIPRVTGTILAGVRFTKLQEVFAFSAVGEAAGTYSTNAENNLAGFQTGGDIWVSLFQGLRMGAEGKVGLYDNHYTLSNVFVSTPVAPSPPDLVEVFRQDQPALIGEASFDIVADVLPSLSLRAGYEVLFMNSLVLAGENFNTASPYVLPGQDTRVPFVMDQGDAFMHGFHAGIEYIW